jgi:putative transposase
MTSADHAGWRSRGYLPHLDAPDLIQHIVFRLADSFPARLREEIVKTPRDDRIEVADRLLDQGHGRRDLACPQIAQLMQQSLLKFDSERYALIAWCVMPNHVHGLIKVHSGTRLDRVVHSWKSFVAHKGNNLLGRTGSFWAPEYFDRYMRDESHLAATRTYIEENPVSARLCAAPSDWPFSSASMR